MKAMKKNSVLVAVLATICIACMAILCACGDDDMKPATTVSSIIAETTTTADTTEATTTSKVTTTTRKTTRATTTTTTALDSDETTSTDETTDTTAARRGGGENTTEATRYNEQTTQPERTQGYSEPARTEAPPPATVRTTASTPRSTTTTTTTTPQTEPPIVTTVDDGRLKFNKSSASNPGFDPTTIAWPEVDTNSALDPDFYMSYMYGGITYLDAMCVDGLGWTKNAEWTDSEISYTSRTGCLVVIRPDYIAVTFDNGIEVPYYYNPEWGVRAIISDNSKSHTFDVSLSLLREVKALLWVLDSYGNEYNS